MIELYPKLLYYNGTASTLHLANNPRGVPRIEIKPDLSRSP